jgi:2-polyprenyl-3-methyl-5-hydroxy-6-metoxy-1,4-benzoquinol methylase
MPEQPAAYYDKFFKDDASYHAHYRNSHYYVHWVKVEFLLRNVKGPILEIGCGPGQLAHMLEDLGYTDYLGFDFSEEAVAMARQNSKQSFTVGDARDIDNFQREYATVICLEVLEHVEEDLRILKNVKPGTFCILSVPNFPAPSHVRYFRSEREVRARYYKLVDINKIYLIDNIYILAGYRDDFKPNLFQRILKTRENVGWSSVWNRLTFRFRIWRRK